MQDGLYAVNDDTGAKRGPFETLGKAREGVADWTASDQEVLVHQVEGGRIIHSWECAEGGVMGSCDFEDEEFDADGLEAVDAG